MYLCREGGKKRGGRGGGRGGEGEEGGEERGRREGGERRTKGSNVSSLPSTTLTSSRKLGGVLGTRLGATTP